MALLGGKGLMSERRQGDYSIFFDLYRINFS